jgi:hypothetical protein
MIIIDKYSLDVFFTKNSEEHCSSFGTTYGTEYLVSVVHKNIRYNKWPLVIHKSLECRIIKI